MGWRRVERDYVKKFKHGLGKKSGAHRNKAHYNRKRKHKGNEPW